MNINQKNKHLRDNCIEFEEDTHKYTVNNKRLISVSQLIHTYFEPFNAKKIINLYYDRWQKNPDSEYYGLSPDEIKQKWNDNRDRAANYGTRVHKQIELYLTGQELTTKTEEFNQFLIFERENSNLEPYRVEWIIYDEDLMIGGTIDAVYKNQSTGQYYIIDWKTNNKITKKNSYQQGKYPINYIDDCNFMHYTLQLSLYKHILETKYGIKIEKTYLCWLNKKNSSYN